MAFDKTNTGTLGKNKNKRPDKQDPDYNGKIDIEGKLYYLDGWIKEGSNDNGPYSFLSLRAKPAGQGAVKAPSAKLEVDF